MEYGAEHLGSIAQALSMDNLLDRPCPIKTGFPMLDAYMDGGITPGLIILGAGPGQGKSTLALQIGEYVSRAENVPVLYFSMEMAKDRIAAKSMAMDNFRQAKADGVDLTQLTSGQQAKTLFFTASELFNPEKLAAMSEQKRCQLQEARRRMGENRNLYIIDEVCNASQIEKIVLKFLFDQKEKAEQTGETYKKPLIIVDYLQIIPPDPNARGIVTDKQ